MSLTRKSIWAAHPVTTRASPTHISVDPKGERIAYGSGKSVFLRSIDDPSVSTQYTGHTATVNVARFSPSGYYVASGDSSGTVRVWDCVGEDMNTKGEFHIISGPIKDLAWDGESKRLIAVGEGKERFGHCITFDTGNSVGEVSGHSSQINSVSIRQQRPYRAATASDDQTLAFYHGTPFKFNTSLTGNHSNFVHGVAFSPDGEYFVSVGADRKIFLYDGKTGEFKSEVTGDGAHKGSILSVSWSPDSKRFVTASADQTVKLWEVESQKNVFTWTFGPEGSSSIADHQVGVVWTPRADGTIISLSLSGDLNYLVESSETPKRVISGHQKAITALNITGKGEKTLFTGSYEGRVYRWNLSTGLAEALEGEGHANTVAGFVETPAGVLSVGWDDKIRRIDAGAGLFVSEAIATESQPKGIAAFNNNQIALLTTNDIRILDANSPSQPIATLAFKFAPISLAASGTTPEFAVGGSDSIIRVFKFASTVSEVTTLNTNRAAITAMAYSPDGAYLAAGDSSGKIVLYAVGENYAVKTTRWAFHTGRVESIAWNAAGSHVASGSLDTNVYIYSVQNPVKNAKVKNSHMGGVNAVAWEDEQTVVSAGADGAVKRWEVKLP